MVSLLFVKMCCISEKMFNKFNKSKYSLPLYRLKSTLVAYQRMQVSRVNGFLLEPQSEKTLRTLIHTRVVVNTRSLSGLPLL